LKSLSHDTRTVEARRLGELARAAGVGDSPDAALAFGQDALALLGADERNPLLADVLRWQGSVLRDRGDPSAARPLYERSLQIATTIEYGSGRAHAINCLATLAQRRGALDEATTLYLGSLAEAERCGDTQLMGMLEQNLGIIADIRGNPASALAHYRVSLQTFEKSNDLQYVSGVLNNLGYLHAKEGRFDEANAAYGRALLIARDRGDLMSEGVIEENRGELRLILNELEDAAPSIERALSIALKRNDLERQASALKLRGALQRLLGYPSASIKTLTQALGLSAVGEDALLGAELLYQFGASLFANDNREQANDAWRASMDAFVRLNARDWVARLRSRLTDGGTDRYF
jgi:tetratricopeptide (TPR) repeat protein